MATWRVEKITHKKFPYRLSIVEGKKETLALLAQDKWPGQKGNLFCLRQVDTLEEVGEVVESCEIVSLRRFGRKLSLILDRANRKRCEFLFLEKPYKNKDGTYEQIFFRTQAGIKQHRSKGKLNLYGGDEVLTIVVESNERYPWLFSGHTVERRTLATGDYALLRDHKIAAVVERKTFTNMLSDIGQLQILHQQLSELALYPHAALVIEAQYSDFLDSQKTQKWSVSHLAKALAELTVLHSELPIIYAGNRKDANVWTLRYFEGITKQETDKTIAPIAKAVSKSRAGNLKNPLWLQVEKAVQEMPEEFKTADVVPQCKGLSMNQVRTQLGKLAASGSLEQVGKGRGLLWRRK